MFREYMDSKLLRVPLQQFADGALNTITTGTSSMSDEMKTFYSDRLIDITTPKLLHAQFADKYKIPQHGGKNIEFRKYSKLAKALTPIVEGTVPAGNSMTVSTITATLSQYGDWMGMSDLFEMTAIDNNILQATKLLGNQAGRTLDTVVRDVLDAGTNVYYALKNPGETTEAEILYRYLLDETCVMTSDLARRVQTVLEVADAETIDDAYVGIIHPYAAYDLTSDPAFIDAHKYQNSTMLYRGEIGMLGNTRYVKTTEAKIVAAANLTAGARNLTVKTAITEAADTIAVKEAITAADATALVGRKVLIGTAQYTVESASAAVAGSATITLTATLTVAVDTVIYPGEAAAKGMSVFYTMVLGANAYADIELQGGGLQHIVKQRGYADELDLRSAVGWKALKACARLLEENIVRIESVNKMMPFAAAN